MAEIGSRTRGPLVLVACGDEQVGNSLDGVLTGTGLGVRVARSGDQALRTALAEVPDAVILDSSLADLSALDLCRTIRQNPRFPAQMPILLLAPAGPARRSERIEALRAGAWDYYSYPLDSEEMLLRLGTYLRAKVATDEIRASGLEDSLTGLYNHQGLVRRLREMCSDAYRKRRALACLVLAPEDSEVANDVNPASVAEYLVWVVNQACRASDTLARLPNNEFVVLAPETGPEGAFRLAERLTSTAGEPAGVSKAGGKAIPIRIGVYAVSDFADSAVDAREVLNRASAALQRSQTGLPVNRIVAFTS